jgi:hypothetical protein
MRAALLARGANPRLEFFEPPSNTGAAECHR